MPHGDEGWHVEGVSQGFATATDERSAFPLAGFAGVRNEAGKAAELSAVQRADLGQEGQDRSRGDLAEPGNRAQDVALTCRSFIGVNEFRVSDGYAPLILPCGRWCVQFLADLNVYVLTGESRTCSL